MKIGISLYLPPEQLTGFLRGCGKLNQLNVEYIVCMKALANFGKRLIGPVDVGGLEMLHRSWVNYINL